MVPEACSWVLSLSLRDPEPCVSPVSLGYGPGWMDSSPDCFWGRHWPGEVPEHLWVWPAHATHGSISHIPFLDFESQQHSVLMRSPVTVTHCVPNGCCC